MPSRPKDPIYHLRHTSNVRSPKATFAISWSEAAEWALRIGIETHKQNVSFFVNKIPRPCEKMRPLSVVSWDHNVFGTCEIVKERWDWTFD